MKPLISMFNFSLIRVFGSYRITSTVEYTAKQRRPRSNCIKRTLIWAFTVCLWHKALSMHCKIYNMLFTAVPCYDCFIIHDTFLFRNRFITLSLLGKISSRQHFKIFFLFFPEKRMTFHANCQVTICMKYQILFFGKNQKKKYFKMSSVDLFLPSMLSINANQRQSYL